MLRRLLAPTTAVPQALGRFYRRFAPLSKVLATIISLRLPAGVLGGTWRSSG